MNNRTYIPTRGFEISESSFVQHQQNCGACKTLDPTKPQSLANLCLDGAVLWKKDNAQPVKREPAPVNPNHTSAKETRRLMRYK